MTYTRHIALLIAFIALTCGHLAAQSAMLRQGDRSYRSMSYLKAIEYYEMAFANTEPEVVHMRRLADCYWTLREFDRAEPWYARLAKRDDAEARDLYRYAELARSKGRFAESDTTLLRFTALEPGDSRGQRKANSLERLSELMEEKGLSHQIMPVPFNSDRTDMSPFIQGDRIMFASARMPEYLVKKHHTWNDQPFLNLYTGSVDDHGNVTGIRPMGDGLNTAYHESNAILSSDGNELYFTRNNVLGGRKTAGSDGVNNLQLFVRTRTEDGWSKEVPFTHNHPDHSIGHPALSKDDRQLYFTSDAPNGHGGKDIWVCERDAEGNWGAPRNLGPEINTEGDEMFPYMHGNFLYFASDGHLGFGGLDIFRVRLRDTIVGEIENLNQPINGPNDDFGFCLDRTGDIGFLTSDRGGPIGGENIYLFRMHSRPEDERIWVGRVMDERTAQPVPYLTMRLLDEQRNELARAVTSELGIYQFDDPGIPAMVSTSIPGGVQAELPLEEIAVSKFGDTELPDMYLNSTMDLPVNAIIRDAVTDEFIAGVAVTVRDLRDGQTLFHGITNEHGIAQGQIPDRRFGDDLFLEVTFARDGYFTVTTEVDFRVLMFLEQALAGPEGQKMTPVMDGVDISAAMNLRPIFFEYDDDRITSSAAGELDLVAHVMEQDPFMRIDLRSHTDSRAGKDYNLALSQRRADNTKAYLVGSGIAAHRITARGFGESEIRNHCVDGVECTEAEHFENRRTEFIITECKECGSRRSTVQAR